MNRRLLSLAIVLGAGWAQGGAFSPPERGADLPAELQAVWPKLAAKLRPVFWQRTVDFHDGAAPAWLVGGAGAGERSASRVLLVDPAGKLLAEAPAAAEGYESGFVAGLGRGRYALVLTSPAGRRLSSTVTVLLLGDPPTLALRYESPPKGPLWNSVIYLVDLDGDETTELLVDRQVYAGGRRTTEQALYRFNERYADFRESIAPHGWLAKAAEAARKDPATPQAVQYTVSYGE